MKNKQYNLKHKGIKISIGLVAMLTLGSTLAGCGKQKTTQSKAPSVSRKASKPKQKVLKQLPTNMMHMYNSTNKKQANVKELINSNNIIVNKTIENKKNKKARTHNTTININEITKHGSSYHIIGKASNKVMALTLTPSNNGKTVQINEPALKLNFTASVQQNNTKMNKNQKGQKKNKKQNNQNNKNKKQNNNNKALKPNKLPKH